LAPAFVAFDRVCLAYDAVSGNAVEDITLRILRGEFVAIVGPSGCGKSTFMKLCSGLRAPTQGTVVVGGREVAGPLTIVGMAFQAPNLLPWRTTLDNVLLPLEIVEPYRSNFRRNRAEYAERAKALLRTVGLESSEAKFPWQLSGGMQQRTSICRALIHDPELLMLDEPFSALDAFTREELWCVLHDLWAAKRFHCRARHTRLAGSHVSRQSGVLYERTAWSNRRRERDRPAAPARFGNDVYGHIRADRARFARAHRAHPQGLDIF
jgi:NitT/TauT family transport system ATP-binding protein